MSRATAALAVVFVALNAGCGGASGVEASVRDAFVDCMTEQGFVVGDVQVTVGRGSHIEEFSWDDRGDAEHKQAGQECEDAALRQFDVSRT
jgi:hypothetical protein